MSGWELLNFTLESHFLLFAAGGGGREWRGRKDRGWREDRGRREEERRRRRRNKGKWGNRERRKEQKEKGGTEGGGRNRERREEEGRGREEKRESKNASIQCTFKEAHYNQIKGPIHPIAQVNFLHSKR